MKTRKSGSLALLFVHFSILLLLFSCKKEPDDVGVVIRPPDDQVNVFLTEDIDILAYSVIDDSIRTDQTQLTIFGSYMDPVFGVTAANNYTQIRLSENGYDFGENPILDSLVLKLDYAGYYGDTNTQQVWKVFELAEKINPDSLYYSNQSVQNKGIELASKQFAPRPLSRVVVGNDTLAGHIRIRLSDDLGNQFLNAPASAFLDNDAWLEYFYGLYITAEPVYQDGAMIYIDMLSAMSQVELYYRNDEQDSLKFEFLINSNCARFINYDHFDYNHASPEFRAQVVNGDTSLGEERLYLQGMGGIKTRIKFQNLDTLKSQGRVAVNEAKLVINGSEDIDKYKAPVALALVNITEEGKNQVLVDQFESYFGGRHDSISNQYVFRITRHVQNLLKEDAEDYGLYLLVSGASLQATRYVMYGTKPDLSEELAKRLKLRVTYTRVE